MWITTEIIETFQVYNVHILHTKYILRFLVFGVCQERIKTFSRGFNVDWVDGSSVQGFSVWLWCHHTRTDGMMSSHYDVITQGRMTSSNGLMMSSKDCLSVTLLPFSIFYFSLFSCCLFFLIFYTLYSIFVYFSTTVAVSASK